MKIYDEVLKQEVKVHEKVVTESEQEIILNDPDTFDKIFDREAVEDDD